MGATKQSDPQQWMSTVSRIFMLGALSATMLPLSALGQARATVSVDLSKPVNQVLDTSIGAPIFSYNADSFSPAGLPYIRAAGITAVRFPANHGVADLYHWSTQRVSSFKGVDQQYAVPDSNFGNFAQMAEAIGRAVIVVNYGTSPNGKSGGEPAEAAAWVAYANGDPSSTKELGKDSTGHDWQTVGYWAGLRASAPLTDDDGLNFLRINHPRPFNFRLWQVGDQIFKNGFFGGESTGNPDMHGPEPEAVKEWGHLHGDARLGPAAVAENVKAFSKAMKAVDPTIQIGMSFPAPADAPRLAPEWTGNVLKSVCSDIDYVNLDWGVIYTAPPDWQTMDEDKTFASTTDDLANLMNSMVTSFHKSCPANHTPRLAFSPAGIPSWVKVAHPITRALWTADTYAMLMEMGSYNINLPDLYSDAMLSSDHKKLGDTFYALQMLHVITHAPGDLLLTVESNSTKTLNIHATHRRDGNIGLMLINKDPKQTYTVKVTLKNGTPGLTGRRFDYGAEQFKTGAQVAISPFTASGTEFTITVPPYTMTDLLLPDHK